MKEIIVKLLGSVLKAAAVAAVIAAVAYWTGISVPFTFVTCFFAQFIVSYLYNSYLELKAAKIKKEQQLKELEILSRISFNVPCAACKQVNEVVINANSDNNFDCEHCGAKNTTFVSVEAALVTTPVTTNL